MTKRAKVPAPPAGLKPDAVARWKAVYPGLALRGTVDLETLRTYCQLWARWREAENGIQTAGQLVKGAGGRIVPSPFIAIANQAAARVQQLEAHLGLSAVVATAPIVDSSVLLTRRVLAQRLGVHMMTVTKWEREGMPIAEHGGKGRASRYLEPDVRAWLEVRATHAQEGGGGATVDVARERARKERAQAILAEQTFEARSRQLLPAAEVEKAWNAEVQAVRAAILATYTTLADRLHRIAVLEGVTGVEHELKEIAHQLLRELASPDRGEAVSAA